MEENFGAVLNQEWHKNDLKGLISHISGDESLLRLKRRWLMDLSLCAYEEKRVEKMLPPNYKIMPESLLREDDVSYDDIRTFIEKGFGVCNRESEAHCDEKDMGVFNLHDSFRDVFFLLDDMTNKGLSSFIEILTGGMVNFKKTNTCMKRMIRGLLQKVIADKNDIPETKLQQLLQLLRDPQNFRRNQIVRSTDSEAYHAAAVKVLNGLDDLPYRTLRAMHRKLKGVKGYIPLLQPPRWGANREYLTKLVRKCSLKMLSNLVEEAEPPERLAGALGVAGLTLKLMMNCSGVREFRKFSPEIEALQSDIAKAIHLLEEPKTVSIIELRKVQQLLDPNSRLSVRSLRTAIRNLLSEYLLECSDLDEVPVSLLQALDIINRRPQRPSRRKSSTPKTHSSSGESFKEVMQNEVECVLLISAHAKEAVLNLLVGHEFDEDFAHAYMESFEESDALCISDGDDDNEQISQYDEFHSFGQTESIGEANPAELSSSDGCSFSPNGMSNTNLDCDDITEGDSCKKSKAQDDQCSGVQPNTTSHDMTSNQSLPSRPRTPDSNSSSGAVNRGETTNPKFACSDFLVEEANNISLQCGSANQYLEIQEACDATSMIAYRFVGHVLGKLAAVEGLELDEGDRLYLRSYSSIPEDVTELPDELLISEFSEMWRSVLQQ